MGTDCSGGDAPIMGLQAVQLPYGFRHLFSSEVDAKKRSFLKANFPGVVVHHDMLKRDHAQLPHIDMYVCGFPCKPFSRLHVRSKGFREKQARPFRAVIKTLSAKLPVIAVLENVSGLRTHMAKVHRALASIRWYEILTMTIDPYEMGEPVRRQRIYFVLIRVDVAVAHDIKLDEHAQALTAVGLCSHCTEPARRMLPNDSTEVRKYMTTLAGKRCAYHPATSQGRQPKWRTDHQGLRSVHLARPVLGLGARQTEILGIKLAEEGLADLTAKANVDTSQSLTIARCTPYVPTITPGGRIVVGQLRRLVIPIEKCLLNAIPVHDLHWPSGSTDKTIADLGGNTMHLFAVHSRERTC